MGDLAHYCCDIRRLPYAVGAGDRRLDRLSGRSADIQELDSFGPSTDTGRPAGGHDHFQSARLAALGSEEHTSELQSLMRISYAVFCLKKKRGSRKIQK